MVVCGNCLSDQVFATAHAELKSITRGCVFPLRFPQPGLGVVFAAFATCALKLLRAVNKPRGLAAQFEDVEAAVAVDEVDEAAGIDFHVVGLGAVLPAARFGDEPGDFLRRQRVANIDHP